MPKSSLTWKSLCRHRILLGAFYFLEIPGHRGLELLQPLSSNLQPGSRRHPQASVWSSRILARPFSLKLWQATSPCSMLPQQMARPCSSLPWVPVKPCWWKLHHPGCPCIWQLYSKPRPCSSEPRPYTRPDPLQLGCTGKTCTLQPPYPLGQLGQVLLLSLDSP